MHFPSAVGREVIELYVKSTHFTNPIFWDINASYDPFKPVLNASQIDFAAPDNEQAKFLGDNNSPKPTRMIENVRAPAESSKSKAMQSTNWRQPLQGENQAPVVHTNAGPTPTAPTRGGMMHGAATATPPPNIDGHSSPTQRSTQMIQCVIDERGNYHPVTPGGSVSNQPIIHAQGSNQAVQPSDRALVPYGQSPHIGQSTLSNNLQARGRGFHGGSPALRGNHGGMNTPGRGGRASNNPIHAQGQPTYGQAISPAAYPMRSQLGFEDPFSTPRVLHQAKSAANLMPQNTGMLTRPSNATPVFQRAVSSAHFVPQTFATQGGAASSFHNTNQGRPAHGGSNFMPGPPAPSNHTLLSGGGVALNPQHLYGPVPPVDRTPSHVPSQSHAMAHPMNNTLTTPSGLQVFPTPTDPGRDADTDADKLHIEYLEALHREREAAMTLARTKYEKASKKFDANTGSPSMKAKRDPGSKQD